MRSPSVLRCRALALLLLLSCFPSVLLAQTTFSFCHIVTTSGLITYSTWSSVMVGTFTATLLQGQKYNVTAVSGYRNVSSNQLTGAVSSSVALTGIALGGAALGEADSQLTFPTESTYTDASGITILTSSPQSDIGGCASTQQYNLYSDNQFLCGVNGQSVAGSSFGVLSVVAGTTPPSCTVPAKPSNPPTYNSSSASVTFAFCYTTYSDMLVPGTPVWASLTSATVTASQSTYNGQYIVTAMSGYRLASTSTGTGVVASNVSISGVESASTCFGGCDNVLLYGGSGSAATDALGVTYRLSTNQSDPSSCTGSEVSVHGNSSACNSGTSTSTSNTVVVSASPSSTSCAVPAAVTVYNSTYCQYGGKDLSSLASADLSYFDCVSGQTIYMRLCAPVTNAACVGQLGGNSMVCQQLTQYHVWNAAAVNSNTAAGALAFAYHNASGLSSGIDFTTSSGSTCGVGSGRRTVKGTVSCGCANALVGWTESGNCQYTAQLTSPAVCVSTPPQCAAPTLYTFALCQTQGTSSPITGSTWSSLTSALLSATVNACGVYSVQSISGYRLAASTSGSGAVASNATITGLDTTLGDPDNSLTYPASPTYTSPSGLAYTTSTVQSDSVCSNTNTYNIYGDTTFVCGLNDVAGNGQGVATLTITLLTNGAAAPACVPPTAQNAASPAYQVGAGLLLSAALTGALLVA